MDLNLLLKRGKLLTKNVQNAPNDLRTFAVPLQVTCHRKDLAWKKKL